jgi:Fic family protein
MNDGIKRFIWQQDDWPHWRFDHERLAQPLARVHQSQGRLLGRLQDLGIGLREQASLQVWTQDVLKTSEIEGETLNPDSVRSSLARRLGMDIGALAPADRNVEGVIDMVLDATQQHASELTPQRLFGWHAALFPTGYSGLARIRVGAWRDDALGPMQVVSGPLGRQKVHYEAPPADSLAAGMSDFLLLVQQRSARRSGDQGGTGSPVVGDPPSFRRWQRAHRHEPSVTWPWHEPSARRSASTACRPSCNASVGIITTGLSALRRGRSR